MKKIKIFITDNQVISPLESGAPIRIFNLFGKLPKHYNVHYIGVSGWQHLKYKIEDLTENFKEEIVPLKKAFICADNFFTNTIKSIRSFDVLCSYLMFLNPRYIQSIKEQIKKADIIISSHPWFFSYLKGYKNKIKIYDSHNCEYLLYKRFLKGNIVRTFFSSLIKKIEGAACLCSDAILACSKEDKENFIRLYGAKKDKIFVIPNPINTGSILPCNEEEKKKIKEELGLKGKTIVFVGTYYLPNIEAFNFIMQELVPSMKDYTFLIIGTIKNAFLESIDDYLKNISLNKIKIKNQGILGHGYFNLEKWGNKGFDVRWTKKEFSFFIKGTDITKIIFDLRSLKRINGEIFLNNKKIRETAFKTTMEFKKFSFSFPKEGSVSCAIKLKRLNKSLFLDTRDVGIAIKGISYISNGKEKKIALDKTIAPMLVPKNVKLYGRLSNEKLKNVYKAADIAINPMFSGSGLNIKMLDYMAAGLPVVSTEVGARGLKVKNNKDLIVCKSTQFKKNIENLFNNSKLYGQLKKNGRELVEKRYDSKIVTKRLDKILSKFVR